MVQIVWTQGALEELGSICAYVRKFNPLAAEFLGLRLKALAETLKSSPDRGRPITLGRRQLSVVNPYLLRYLRDGNIIYIVEVRHSAREPNI